MALPQSGILSAVARNLANFINTSAEGKPQVRIGPPAEAVPDATESAQIVNLFFYRFEPLGFHADATTEQAYHLRIHCLVTAFANPAQSALPTGGNETLSGGEICLRVLEGVLQLFCEDPVRTVEVERKHPVSGVSETITTLLQIIHKPLASEELSQIWATQGDLHYRPSLLFEFAAVPVTPWNKPVPDKTVVEGGVRIKVEASLAHRRKEQ